MLRNIGPDADRVDGRAKVTGASRFAAEMPLPNLAHGVFVGARIAAGRVLAIDTADAMRVSGVLRVFTANNLPRFGPTALASAGGAAAASFQPMQGDEIFYPGQHIALVVAESLEAAEHAAALVRVRYREQLPGLSFAKGLARAYAPEPPGGNKQDETPRASNKSQGTRDGAQRERQSVDETRGTPQAAFDVAAVRFDQVYTTPVEHHNALELHGTTAVWDGDRLTVYEPSQWVKGAQSHLASAMRVPLENVRVVSHYVGGAFGSKAVANAVFNATGKRIRDLPLTPDKLL